MAVIVKKKVQGKIEPWEKRSFPYRSEKEVEIIPRKDGQNTWGKMKENYLIEKEEKYDTVWYSIPSNRLPRS